MNIEVKLFSLHSATSVFMPFLQTLKASRVEMHDHFDGFDRQDQALLVKNELNGKTKKKENGRKMIPKQK